MREWFRNSNSRRRRPLYGLVAVFTLVALLGMQAGALARLQASLDGPSPASGHASVAAQGVSELPFDPIAWRVVRDTAEPLDVALPVERALGFVVAEPEGVHVVDVSAGTQERLAKGEASFVAESAAQTRASLTDAETSYLRIALVGEDDVNDPGNDEMIFAGTAFAAPEGRRDIDLLRDVLQQDEESQIAGGEYPVLIVATGGAIEISAGGEPVQLQAGEAAEFTGDITVVGLQDSSSFIAGVIGPDVPVPPRNSGTITVATYLCEPGVTPADLGDPVDEDAAASCAPVSDDVAPTITNPDGDELTTETAEAVRDGTYGWIGVPFGDYSVNAPAELPEGAGDPTFFDGEGNALGSGDLTIDRDTPDAHVDIYLFQSGSGSISLTAYACPEGWTLGEGQLEDCEPVTEGFDVTFLAGDADGGQISLADAELADGTYLWTGLGVSPDEETGGAGHYIVDAVDFPEGYGRWHMEGAHVPSAIGETNVNLTTDAPEASISLYFWNETEAGPGGTITLDTLECPSADSGPEECSRNFGPTGVTGVYIQDVDGENGALTESTAAQEGDGPFVWPQAPLASYFMDTSALTAPEGYEIVSVVLTPDGADVSGGFELTEDNTIANIVVLVAPVGGSDETNSADADSDGLSDANEASAGTDAANPDSDGDCHADGPETDAGTDPLSAESFPEGDCDSIEANEEN